MKGRRDRGTEAQRGWAVLVAAALLVGCDDGVGQNGQVEQVEAAPDPTSSPEALMAYVETLVRSDPAKAGPYYELVIWNEQSPKQLRWRDYVNNLSIPNSRYAQAFLEKFGRPPGNSRGVRVSRFDAYELTADDGRTAEATCTHLDREFVYYLVNTEDGWRISGDTFEKDPGLRFDSERFDKVTGAMPGFGPYIARLEQRVRAGEFATAEEAEVAYRLLIHEYGDDQKK